MTALYVACLVLFVVANLFPFIGFEMEGLDQVSHLATGIVEFYRQGFWELALLVAMVTLVFPLAKILATLYVLFPLDLGYAAPGAGRVFGFVCRSAAWSMLEVFLLGVIVAYVKLVDLANIELGPSLYAFIALIIVMTFADANLPAHRVWSRLGPGRSSGLARNRRHTVCHSCHFIAADAVHGQDSPLDTTCPRCRSVLHWRKPESLNRTAALLLTAAILYIPANTFPIMTVTSFGQGQPDTIMSGVITLIEHDMLPIALLVFFASIAVPVLKLMGMAFLLVSVHRGWVRYRRDRARLYRIIEAVGRWSMIDVFMIAILTSLVKLGNIASIEPGVGVVSFAAVVIITMLASHQFDPRLIWDRPEAEGL